MKGCFLLLVLFVCNYAFSQTTILNDTTIASYNRPSRCMQFVKGVAKTQEVYLPKSDYPDFNGLCSNSSYTILSCIVGYTHANEYHEAYMTTWKNLPKLFVDHLPGVKKIFFDDIRALNTKGDTVQLTPFILRITNY